MCGIFGIVAGQDSGLPPGRFEQSLSRLFKLSESRGREASGLAVRTASSIHVHREPKSASYLLRSAPYRRVLSEALGNGAAHGGAAASISTPVAFVGHSRLATNGLAGINTNNQPVVKRGVVGVHNGIIVNVDALWARHPELTRRYEIDTEIVMDLIRHFHGAEGSLQGAVRRTFEEVEGAASIGVLLDDTDALLLATNTGSMYTWASPSHRIFLFASERYILEQTVAAGGLRRFAGGGDPLQIRPGEGRVVDLTNAAVHAFSFAKPARAAGPAPGRGGRVRRIVDTMREDEAARDALRRCSRCVLPETMPFIEFDEDGVCSFCRHHRRIAYRGRRALEEALAPYRSANGAPDCIFPFSGGRDSSYGLHLVKNEFGMNPIAYTYDWGMVNDLARRNQARLTGKLGVEHVIVSADIKKKRRNIKLNVEAWLRQPDLGMVPLFMAGDKQFFHYANRLARQTGVRLIIWSANQLERTEFKYGFCGVRGGVPGIRIHNLRLRDTLRMVLYYGWRYFRNPRYLNRTLFDTGFAFLSYYFFRQDSIWLYDYHPWDENTIDELLGERYGWETAADTGTTWRIGDGTAAFYNYIYHTVAGFTENDTFRSNQVRDGILTRDEALARVARENAPRYDSIKEYTETIGVDFDETLSVIDSMPKLYRKNSPRGAGGA